MRTSTGLVAAALAACMVTPAQAQPFEQDIPLDLARVLISPGRVDNITFHQGFPPEFPDIELPSGVSVMGSMGQRNADRVVLHARPEAGQQREALLASMETQGYQMLTRPPQQDPDRRGFVSPEVIPPSMPVQLCHDDHGTIMVQVVSGTAEPLLLMTGTGSPQQMQMSCEQQAARMELMGRPGPGGGGLQRYMPRLELPPGASDRRPSIRGWSPFGMSGSGNSVRTSADVTSDWAPDRLHEHFAAQLREQGWTVDAEGAGSQSASSGWLGEEEDESLLGSLQVLSSAEGQYQVTFLLIVLPE